MVATSETPLVGEWDGCDDKEIISFDEFVNKMQSYNEIDIGCRYPRDPYRNIYKIMINNTFKHVHLTKAFESIDYKLGDYVAECWNEGVPPTIEMIDERRNAIFKQKTFNDDVKNILLQGINESMDDE